MIGCIDRTFEVITAPWEQARNYVTRHHNHAIIIQAVCDHNLLYRDVYVGEAGSVGDARAFARSPLCDTLVHRPDLIDEDEHILGDGAYPLSKHVSFLAFRCTILPNYMQSYPPFLLPQFVGSIYQ